MQVQSAKNNNNRKNYDQKSRQMSN